MLEGVDLYCPHAWEKIYATTAVSVPHGGTYEGSPATGGSQLVRAAACSSWGVPLMLELQGERVHVFREVLQHQGVRVVVWPEYSLSTAVPELFRLKLRDVLQSSQGGKTSLYVAGSFVHTRPWRMNLQPVVHNGSIKCVRPKYEQSFNIQSHAKAARAIGRADLAEKLDQSADRSLSQAYFHQSADGGSTQAGLIQEISEAVHNHVHGQIRRHTSPIDVDGISILPVICNELARLPDAALSEADIIAESAYQSPKWRHRYERLNVDGVIDDGVMVVRADGLTTEESGCYVVRDGTVEVLE